MAPKRDNTARTISWVMAITLIGKVMGLYRDRLLAVRYSVGMEANAFFTASRIPRVFFDAVFASAIAAWKNKGGKRRSALPDNLSL